MYRANMAAKQYALMKEFTYKYKIRLRPDVALVQPMPLPNQMNFTCYDSTCAKIIYYPNPKILTVGSEDTFNIGEAETMDHVLDRYVDLTTKRFIKNRWRTRPFWNSESFLIALLKEKYNVSLRSHNDIWMLVLRKPDHPANTRDRDSVPRDNKWLQLNAKNL
jgi:hypothetical protein